MLPTVWRTPLALSVLLAGFLIALTQSEVDTLPPFLPREVAEAGGRQPTLEDYWNGSADFVMDIEDTGLPMGESETIALRTGDVWSFVHASHQSAGVVDQCGDPVEFPGCMVIYKSKDGGKSFTLPDPVCQIECLQCPCDNFEDHPQQQQYPQVWWDGRELRVVYEHVGRTILRRSHDLITWTYSDQVGETGFRPEEMGCVSAETIGDHPHSPGFFTDKCLAGGPPGLFVEGDTIYVFVALGLSPGSLGCFKGTLEQMPITFSRCDNNPLLEGIKEYGPHDGFGPDMNQWYDFRVSSSAEVHRVGDRYYMLYEGIRGPHEPYGDDSQFALAMARTVTDQIDGPWEKFAGNPILVDLPANVGLGHADIFVRNSVTYLYTSLDGDVRSRLRLTWK